MGDFFIIPSTAITDTEQRVKEKRWQAMKDLEGSFDAVCSALIQVFERVIDPAYHTGATGMCQRGFGYLTPRQILDRLIQMYGQPQLHELKAALKRLHNPMDRNQPTKVMLHSIKEIQMFLLLDKDKDRHLKEVNLISHALIKLLHTGLYAKANERWAMEWTRCRRPLFVADLLRLHDRRIRAHASRGRWYHPWPGRLRRRLQPDGRPD